MKADTVQSMKEVYESRREGHTRAIAEYMTTGAVGPMGVQDTTAAARSGPQGMGVDMEGEDQARLWEDTGRGEVGEAEQVKWVEEVEQLDEAKTDKAAEQTDGTTGQTRKTEAQIDKTTKQTYNSRPRETDKQMVTSKYSSYSSGDLHLPY